jgi:hypothetical protein
MPGGKHHDNGLDRKVINGLARDERADSLKRTHKKPPEKVLTAMCRPNKSNLIANEGPDPWAIV